MITVTCPDCTETRELRAAPSLVMLCPKCAQAQRHRRMHLARARSGSVLPGLIRRVAAIVETLRRMEPYAIEVAHMRRELDAIEARLAAVISVVTEDLICGALSPAEPAEPAERAGAPVGASESAVA